MVKDNEEVSCSHKQVEVNFLAQGMVFYPNIRTNDTRKRERERGRGRANVSLIRFIEPTQKINQRKHQLNV